MLILAQIHEQVTTIIHNAYRVDFNLSLTSFEPQLVILRNLINLALSSARATLPSVVFTSSVGVLRSKCSLIRFAGQLTITCL